MVRLLGTRWSFSLDPGFWNIKEHVLVTMTAASGAAYNLGYTLIVLAEFWYDEHIKPVLAIFFMLAIAWTGYSFAVLLSRFFLQIQSTSGPGHSCRQHCWRPFGGRIVPSRLARHQMKMFFFAPVGMTLWQFLSECDFPFNGLPCWVAPRNSVANFIRSRLGGKGFLNLFLTGPTQLELLLDHAHPILDTGSPVPGLCC